MIKNKSTLCVRVFGGLGNQLFIYAYARAASLKYGYKLIFDLKSGFLRDQYGRKPELKKHIAGCLAANLSMLMEYAITKKFPNLSSHIFKSRLFIEADSRELFDFKEPENCNLIFLEGYFQSYLYFQEYKDQIRADISLNFERSKAIDSIADNIVHSNSVNIHVRRIQYSHLLTLEYYEKAIDIIKKNINNPVFYVFSDNIDWCRENFKGLGSFTFVVHDITDEAADMWLMTQCKHHIIANSSFSWWGAWLGEGNEQSIVVAPKQTQIGVKAN